MEYTVHTEPPLHFTAHAEAAGCYLWCKGRFLLLRRHKSKPQGCTWGVPAGKLEVNESPKEAVIREIQEEVGINISCDTSEIGKLYIQLPHVSYIYHMFYKQYDTYPEITLAVEENDEARWVTFQEALTLPLISAGKEALLAFRDYLDGVGVAKALHASGESQ